ncbi:MAG: hypothetical protein HY820_43840 [Acidobacteria bacterium]|nr:hypothetical protein [Acidobacteriota bacterium]
MSASKAKREVDTLLWTAADRSIECPWAILEEIHAVVQEGFRRLSKGGVEAGGILFGRRNDQIIRVMAWRPIPCEHARGAAFLLSNEDKQRLMGMMEAAESDPQLQVLEPVGWFVSHTRSGVALTDDDEEVYGQFFPEPWQVTLVYKPDRMAETRAGFFVRERGGTIRRESSYQEFKVENSRSVVPRPIQPTAEPRPFQARRDGIATIAPRPKSRLFAWASAAVGVLACALAVFALPELRTAAIDPQNVRLSLMDAAGQLRVEWDRESAAVRNADSAVLYIEDAGKLDPIDLDRETTRAGSLTYHRLSEDVKVRLVLRQKGKPVGEQWARYVGSPVPKSEAKEMQATREKRERLQVEAERLREELTKQAKATRELQVKMKRLERDIQRESKR